jgi:hypothetical protein
MQAAAGVWGAVCGVWDGFGALCACLQRCGEGYVLAHACVPSRLRVNASVCCMRFLPDCVGNLCTPYATCELNTILQALQGDSVRESKRILTALCCRRKRCVGR